jgi:hypothetical protein
VRENAFPLLTGRERGRERAKTRFGQTDIRDNLRRAVVRDGELLLLGIGGECRHCRSHTVGQATLEFYEVAHGIPYIEEGWFQKASMDGMKVRHSFDRRPFGGIRDSVGYQLHTYHRDFQNQL